MKRLQTKQIASSETDELGSNAESGRGATQGKIFNGRTKNNGNFYAGSCFNPGCRDHNRNIARRRFDFSMNKGDNRAVIVIRNCPAVQPHMKGRPHLGGGHEQPHRK